MKRFDTTALALAFGTAWALLVLATGWTAALLDWELKIIKLISSIYLGFSATFLGGIIGGVWGFISGVLWGSIIGSVYNKLARD